MVKLKIKNDEDCFPDIIYRCNKCDALAQFYTIPPRKCVGCGLKIPNLIGLMEEKDIRKHYHKEMGT